VGDTLEAARARRRRDMENARLMAMEVAARMTEAMAGRLPDHECPMFSRIKDPVVSLSRLLRVVGQLGLLEERFAEDAETRAKRIEAEQAAREQAARAARARLEREAEQDLYDEKKKTIRSAMRQISRDAEPDLPYAERELRLDDLFEDFENYEDYDGDPVEIVATLCAAMGLRPEREFGQDDTPEAEKARAHTMAKTYLDALARNAANRNAPEPVPIEEEPPAPLAKGQGPP